MTDNSARKRAIRALATAEGISYTAARRRYDSLSPTSDDAAQRRTHAQLAFLQRLLRTPKPAAPPSGNEWRITFKSRSDLSLPLALYVTDGGLVGQQSLWRGEKFQIVGFAEAPEVSSGIALNWVEMIKAERLGEVPGKYPVIADLDGNWSTWDTEIASISFRSSTATGPAIVATFTPTDDRPHADPTLDLTADPTAEGSTATPYFNFRIEDLLPALSDQDLASLAADEWVAGARISGVLYRAALVRHDPGAIEASEWVERLYDQSPDRWADDEPFRLVIDENAAQQWLENNHPHLVFQ